MKHFLRWLGRVIGTALALVLVIVLLPYASKWASKLLPDLSGAAVNTSVTLSQKLSESARLECIQVDVEGVLDSTTNALFLGTVQSVQIAYTYHASIGIDLTKVQIRTDGDTVVLELPEMEVLADSLTPTTIQRNDFWYPLTDERRQQLLNDEQEARREKHLAEVSSSEDGWDHVINALSTTIAAWSDVDQRVTFRYEHP
jgi:hypothetical protein